MPKIKNSQPKIDFNQLSDLGLIWKINKEILHPLGLALMRSDDGGSPGIAVAEDGVFEYPPESDIRNAAKVATTKDLHKSGLLNSTLRIKS